MKKINQKEEKKEAIMPILKKLKVGESHSYPVCRINVVRSVACQVSLELGVVFKTKLERPNLLVTRIK